MWGEETKGGDALLYLKDFNCHLCETWQTQGRGSEPMLLYIFLTLRNCGHMKVTGTEKVDRPDLLGLCSTGDFEESLPGSSLQQTSAQVLLFLRSCDCNCHCVLRKSDREKFNKCDVGRNVIECSLYTAPAPTLTIRATFWTFQPKSRSFSSCVVVQTSWRTRFVDSLNILCLSK